MRRTMLAASLCTGLFATTAHTADLAAYGKLPQIEDVSVSPDGTRIAYSLTDGQDHVIVVKRAADDAVIGGLRAGQKKVRGVQWAGSDHLIVVISSTGYLNEVVSDRAEWSIAEDYDVVNHTQRELLHRVRSNGNDADNLNVIEGGVAIRILNGRPYAFVAGIVFDQGSGRLGLFKVDIEGGDTAVLIDPGAEHRSGYLVDADGKIAAITNHDQRTGKWTLQVPEAGHWAAAGSTTDPIDSPDLWGLTADGQRIVLITDSEKGGALVEVSRDGKTWSKPRPAPEGPILDRITGAMIGEFHKDGDSFTRTYYDPKDQRIWDAVSKAYPGAHLSDVSFSNDRMQWVLLVDSPTEGPAYAQVDLAARHGHWLGPVYPDLSPDDVQPQTSFTFKAADGLEMSGYLTLPRGSSGKALPAILFPHGGPEARDYPGWDWWAQAMASRGYAVIQVNYRGSSGYGWDLLSAGFGQWGRKMQTDLSDAVDFLTKQGTIDPKRVCIVGASYGGYAALAGVTLQSGVYRCAVSVAGPSDLKQMVHDKAGAGFEGAGVRRYWKRYMGADDQLPSISPAQQAAKAAAPILLIHGKDDTVVSFEQSQIMADALKAAGKPVPPIVVLEKEDHWLSSGATRLQMLRATLDFVEKHNPAR